MTVSAEHFELNGKNYASLKFKNTTNQDLRILWSVQLRGTDFPVNMDGTTQAYLTIPAGETAFFGKSNSTDPWMDLESRQWEEEIQVNIEIQNAL